MLLIICAVIACIAAGLRLLNMADDRATAIGVLALGLAFVIDAIA